MKVTLNDVEQELTADLVRERLSGATPQRVRHQGVRVEGRVFPIKQAFALVSGESRTDFTAQAAARQLASLGFELVGETEPRRAAMPAADATDEQWPSRPSVQSLLVAHLEASGWRLDGADLATRDGETLVSEVTGYPGRDGLADRWYAQAVLAAMLTRSRRPDARSVIVVPDVKQYGELYADTAGSLALSGIEVWWVAEDGDVTQA